MLFHTGGEPIVDNLFEMITEEVADQFARRCWDKLAAVAAGFFLDNFADDSFCLVLRQSVCFAAIAREYDDVTRLAFVLAFLGIPTSLDGVDDGRVGAWAADAKFFELLDQHAFGVTSWWACKDLLSFDAMRCERVATTDLW